MRQDPLVSPILDILIRQSLAAIEPDDSLDDDIRCRFETAFDAIRRFYRSAHGAICQSIVEPGAAIVQVNQRNIRCSRLLVQCMKPAASRARALMFAYAPDHVDRIALDIMHSDANYRTSQYFQWTELEGWCSPNGQSLNDESHASVLRAALYESGLFNSSAMTLLPKDAKGEIG